MISKLMGPVSISPRLRDGLIVLALIAITVLTYCYGMGTLSLTEPDEVFYAQTAKEMLQHKTWSVPYIFGKPQFEKPILYYFLLAVMFKFFGVSAAMARFWSAAFGIIGVVLTYFLGKKIYGRSAGFIAAVILATSLEYLSLSRAVLTDIAFSALLSVSLAFFYFGYLNSEKRMGWFLLSFISAGLATLTKGPIGIILPLFIILLFVLFSGELKLFFSREILMGLVAFIVIALPWYWSTYGKFGQQFIDEFFIRDNINRFFYVAEHKDNNTWYYYPTTTLAGFLPWSLFLIAGLFKLPWRKSVASDENKGVWFLCCWIVVIFIFFSLAKSKLISYVFPVFPALAIITAGYFERLIKNREGKLSISFMLAVFFLAALFISGGVYGIQYNKVHHFLPKNIGYIPLICLGLPALAALAFGFLKRYKESLALLAVGIIALVIAGETWLVRYIDPLVSSRASVETLKNYLGQKEAVLLCNKSFARGLLYYTGFPVVVMDGSPNPFFAQHPVTVLYKKDQIREFLLSRPETFCIVKRGNLENIEEIGKDIALTTIYQDQERFIVKVTPSK